MKINQILSINGGSSSIKFALYTSVNLDTALLTGTIERIGIEGTSLTIVDKRSRQHDKLSSQECNNLLNHKSGLLGVSGISADMRDLLKLQHSESHAAEAIELFCYQVKKYIGAYSAALKGLDTLVFSGGIGENAASVRARICEGMEYLGIKIDTDKNESHQSIISAPRCFSR